MYPTAKGLEEKESNNDGPNNSMAIGSPLNSVSANQDSDVGK